MKSSKSTIVLLILRCYFIKDIRHDFIHGSVGQDVIAGEQTTKYKVAGNEGTGPYTVFFWMTDDGITMRTEGSSSESSFEMHLDGLQRGAQPAALFEVPAGVQLMPANPAMMNQMMQGQGQ